jgi:hypothetical protein
MWMHGGVFQWAPMSGVDLFLYYFAGGPLVRLFAKSTLTSGEQVGMFVGVSWLVLAMNYQLTGNVDVNAALHLAAILLLADSSERLLQALDPKRVDGWMGISTADRDEDRASGLADHVTQMPSSRVARPSFPKRPSSVCLMSVCTRCAELTL